MNVNKKLLRPEEQTMLLASLLFARKHLDEILSFLPEQQSERMHEAKYRFLKLEQEERITQIILELRRLLLIKEHNIRWIHKSWIEEELTKEPLYLRSILQQSFGEKNKSPNDESKIVPHNQIVQSFLAPFLRTPQKIAIFDPVLMRLQSLNRTNQEQSIFIIGECALSALSHAVHRKRFIKFIMRSYKKDVELSFDYLSPDGNPLALGPYKKALLKLLLQNRGRSLRDLTIASGIMIMALYLTEEKPRWQRMIEMVLARPHGLMLRSMIADLKGLSEGAKAKACLGSLLIDAMEGAFL